MPPLSLGTDHHSPRTVAQSFAVLVAVLQFTTLDAIKLHIGSSSETIATLATPIQCCDVRGTYQESSHHTTYIVVTQDRCNITFEAQEGADRTKHGVVEVSADGIGCTVKIFSEAGTDIGKVSTNGDISFTAGNIFKVNPIPTTTVHNTVTGMTVHNDINEECTDISGTYREASNLDVHIIFSQDHCDLEVHNTVREWEKSKGKTNGTHVIVLQPNGEMIGKILANGNIEFDEPGGHFGGGLMVKQTPSTTTPAVTTTSQKITDCLWVAGHYVGNLPTSPVNINIRQNDCMITINVPNEAINGHIIGSHVKIAKVTGDVAGRVLDNGDIEFNDLSRWVKQ